ncbi:MAG: hypothetical protein E6Q67_12530 [Roseateles sp.]|nr:MAG: hypothetical protein E6Q67_12530 [Roseateles sp.]
MSAIKISTAHIRSQGGSVPPKSPSERHATVEELSQAIAQLTKAELLRLTYRAKLLAWGTEYANPLELFNEACKRALIAASGDRRDGERGRPWPIDRVPLPAFLSGCMDSIAEASRDSAYQTKTDRLEAVASETGDVDAVIHKAGLWNSDVVEQAVEAEDIAERQEAAQRNAEAIEKHFANDQNVLAVIEGEKAGLSVAEVLEMFEIDQTAYDSARRKLRRKVDKLMPGRRKA